MIFEYLQQLGARLTPQRIVLGNCRIHRDFRAHPPYYNHLFLQLLRQHPEINNKLRSLNNFDGETWVKTELDKFILHQEELLARQKEVKEEQETLSERQEKLLKTHTLLVDTHSGDRFLWLNAERRLSEWNVNAWINAFFQKHRAKLLAEAPFGRLVFDPTKGTQNCWNDQFEGHETVFCNVYRPPVWYTQNLNTNMENQKETYPDLFNYLMNNLIPYQPEREVVLNWLALAVFDRPHALLSLRGVRGNGKTTLKHIFYHLIGNFIEAQQEIFGDFNAEIRNRRCFGIDDNKAIGSRDGHNLRKRLTNPIITLNEKFVQTKVSEKLWASIIVCSNTEDDFHVEYDERKLVSVWLTTKKMEKWPQMSEKIFDWLRPFEQTDESQLTEGHIEFLRQIGHALFIRQMRVSASPAFEYRGGHFWEDVIRSLPAFKRYVVDMVQNADDETPMEYEILKADFEALNGRNVLSWYRLAGWLESSFNLAGEPLITSIDKNEKSFTPNLKLRRK